MLVVLDANVFVSAAIQRGASHRIIQSWLTGTASFEVVMCPALLAEIRDVLTTRPRLRKWISLETATLFADTIGTLIDLVDDPERIDTEARDPDDDYLTRWRERTTSSSSCPVTRTSSNGSSSNHP